VTAPVTVRELGAAELDELAPRLLAIQHAAYAIEAALIGDDRIPPLHEGDQEVLPGLWISRFRRGAPNRRASG